MTFLLDTNVVLDLLLDRAPFADDAAAIFAAVEKGEIRGFLGATTVTTIHYLLAKHLGRGPAQQRIQQILELFDVAPVTRVVLHEAVAANMPDFEDAVLLHAALHAGVGAIVTRNARDFAGSSLPVYSPAEVVATLIP